MQGAWHFGQALAARRDHLIDLARRAREEGPPLSGDEKPMHHQKLSCIAVLALVLSQFPARAKDKALPEQPLPPVFEAVVHCRALTADSERLACYDRSVAALADAREKQDIVVADRATIRETKRGLFGFSLPRLKLFGGTEGEDVKEIDGTIAAVRSTPDGLAIFTLADGARWKQTDGGNSFAKAGDTIRIRRGALGSYLASISKSTTFRIVRLSQ
jgi:hypothetical protein